MQAFSVLADAEAVAQAAADFTGERIRACVDAAGVCHIALPGGTTPARCLELLARKPLPWQRVHWYIGDERCYPAGHAERNDTMIEHRLWTRISAPEASRHPIPAELGAERAAEIYTGVIEQIGALDIVVLGMGEDGHTASLFPDNTATESALPVVAVHDAPKPPAERVSLGLSTLQSARTRIVLVTGSGKREALARVRGGAGLPIGRIGQAHWFVDRAAADVK